MPMSWRLLEIQRRCCAQSCSSEWSYRVDGICDLDLRKKGQNAPWPTFRFPVPVRWWLELERSYLADWQMRGSRCSLRFGRPWPTFATVPHLNNWLRPPSAYTAVVRLLTTAAFLVYDTVVKRGADVSSDTVIMYLAQSSWTVDKACQADVQMYCSRWFPHVQRLPESFEELVPAGRYHHHHSTDSTPWNTQGYLLVLSCTLSHICFPVHHVFPASPTYIVLTQLTELFI